MDKKHMHSTLQTEDVSIVFCSGWRRSGRWLYKPVHEKTCCQLLTIRLDVDKFAESKRQRKVRRKWLAYVSSHETCTEYSSHEKSRMNLEDERELLGQSPKRSRDAEYVMSNGEETFLTSDNSDQVPNKRPSLLSSKRHKSLQDLREIGIKDAEGRESPSAVLSEKMEQAFSSAADAEEPIFSEAMHNNITNHTEEHHRIERMLCACLRKCVDRGDIPRMEYPPFTVKFVNQHHKRTWGTGMLYSVPTAHAIAAKIRKADAGSRVSAQQIAETLTRSLAERIGPFSIKAIGGYLNIYEDGGCIPQKSQIRSRSIVDSCSQRKCQFREMPPGNLKGNLKGKEKQAFSEFKIVTVASTDESLAENEFELFKKYQVQHHGDDPSSVSKESFERFLCDTPLVPVPASHCKGSSPSTGYGSFHQQYWLGDKLIAVGVIDVLPKCLSSKYFFWDPDMAKYSLGTLASLLEIDWIKKESENAPHFHYYYLGYYLHNCHRMRYKADFCPSDLLCPRTFKWFPVTDVLPCLGLDQRPPDFNSYILSRNAVHDSEIGKAGKDEGQHGFEDHKTGGSTDTCSESAAADVSLLLRFPQTLGTMNNHRRSKIIKFGKLCSLGLISSASAQEHLQQRLEDWIAVVGPGHKSILYAV